jgi:hypothetical protein
MGSNVGLEESILLSLCGLVGRFSYRSLCKDSLSDWISDNWLPILGYVPEHITLSFGWFDIIFNSSEDSQLILDTLWTISGCSLMLKRWRVTFDPATEYFCLRHLWVLLSGLPLQYWTEKALAAIGNELGRFICLDSNLLNGSNRKMARILVEMDIHAGLPKTLEIFWHGRSVTQRLDYLGIPFRCSCCHKMGHLWRDCTGEPKEEESEGSYLRKLAREDSPGVDSFILGVEDTLGH